MPIYAGHIRQIGVDANAKFSLPGGVANIDSVNRKYRGQLNQTRDPYVGMDISYIDEETREVHRNGNVSGSFGYEAIAPGTNPHIIIAVGDSIVAGRVFTRAIEFRTLYKGIDPQWEHSFFAQQQNILVFQNGKQLPLAWDGTQDDMKFAKDFEGVVNPMPIGNIMVSANGRILVATEDNLVFASDYVYSLGLGTTNGCLNFTESTYPNSGDGFGAYSEIGPITGMATMSAPGTINGDGETIVFGPRGAWSIATNRSRDTWTSADIQRKVLVGRGTTSPDSIILANNDIWYRSSDRAIASFRSQLTDKDSRWSDQSLSSEVQPYLNYDDSINLRFSSGIFINNRLFMSCAIRKSESDTYGIHRYGLGMVVLDFDRGSSTSRQDEGYSWDGLYTGPRVTGMVKLTPDLQERGFFLSFDSDGINRVYEIIDRESEDVVGDHLLERQIESNYTTHPLLENQEPANEFITYNLTGTRLKVQDVSNAKISQEYRSDRSLCWKEIIQLTEEGREPCDSNSPIGKELSGTFRSGINSTTPDQSEFPSGEHFQIRTFIKGRASVRSLRITAEPTEINRTDTSSFKDDKKEDNCCEDLTNRFIYQF